MSDDIEKKVEDGKKEVSNTATDIKTASADKARELGAAARDKASDLYQQGKTEAQAHAHAAQSRAAGETEATADAMRRAGERFDEDDFRRQAATQLADGIGSFADQIRGKDLSEVPNDLRTLARRNPLVFYAGAALAGFALARMAKATDRDGPDYDYDEELEARAAVHTLPARPKPTEPVTTTTPPHAARTNGAATSQPRLNGSAS